MKKFAISDNTELELEHQSDKAFRARIIYSSEDKLVQADLGTMYAYFLERPTVEDASPYWSIHLYYEVEKPIALTKEILLEAIKVLEVNRVLMEPVWLIGQAIPSYESSKGISIQSGKIFPDDSDVHS